MNLQRIAFLYLGIAFFLNLGLGTPFYDSGGHLISNYTPYNNTVSASQQMNTTTYSSLQNPNQGWVQSFINLIPGASLVTSGLTAAVSMLAFIYNMFSLGVVISAVGFPEPIYSFLMMLNYLGFILGAVYVAAFISGRGLFSLG